MIDEDEELSTQDKLAEFEKEYPSTENFIVVGFVILDRYIGKSGHVIMKWINHDCSKCLNYSQQQLGSCKIINKENDENIYCRFHTLENAEVVNGSIPEKGVIQYEIANSPTDNYSCLMGGPLNMKVGDRINNDIEDEDYIDEDEE